MNNFSSLNLGDGSLLGGRQISSVSFKLVMAHSPEPTST